MEKIRNVGIVGAVSEFYSNRKSKIYFLSDKEKHKQLEYYWVNWIADAFGENQFLNFREITIKWYFLPSKVEIKVLKKLCTQ